MMRASDWHRKNMDGPFTTGSVSQRSKGVLAVRNINPSLLVVSLALAPVAMAQTKPPEPDNSLTLHGITIYGLVDLGLQYETHGAPYSDFFPAGGNDLLQKNSNKPVTGITPNNFSQSRVGIQGKEPLLQDWSAIFRLETYFNPQAGNLSDALKSLTLNNGKAVGAQSTGVDSSVAGQPFQISYVGVSSPRFGTLTFGRQMALMADGIGKYDPLATSNAFSVIGYSGAAAGAGDTEDRRYDQSVKYVYTLGGYRAGVQYKFNGSRGEAATAFEAQVGADFGPATIDGFYAKVRDAVGAGSLSAAQVAALPTLGYSSSNSVTGTISDNTAFALMGSYVMSPATLYAGYEHIRFANPATPLAAGYSDEGGYILAFVNNTAYTNNKNMQIYWAGVKYTVNTTDLYAAYYGYHQAAFAAGDLAGCSSTASGACSGELTAFSLAADWRLSKRFDVYFGAMYSGVSGGLANGYLVRSTIDPTLGARFKF
jgi:predicted porin